MFCLYALPPPRRSTIWLRTPQLDMHGAQVGTVEKIAPEAEAVIRLAVLGLPLLRTGTTPGIAAQQLSLRSSRAAADGPLTRGSTPSSARVALAALVVLGPWAMERIQRLRRQVHLPSPPEQPLRPPQGCAVLWDLAQSLWQAGQLWNTLAFLRHGRHATLQHRLVGLTLVTPQSAAPAPSPAFDLLSRQLVWDECMGFLAFLQQSMPWDSLRRTLVWLLHWVRRHLAAAMLGAWRTLGLPAVAGSSEHKAADRPTHAAMAAAAAEGPAPPCGTCSQNPAVHPVVLSPCGHVHCYYCLAAPALQAGTHLPLFTLDEAGTQACGAGCLGVEQDACRASRCSQPRALRELVCPLCSTVSRCAVLKAS